MDRMKKKNENGMWKTRWPHRKHINQLVHPANITKKKNHCSFDCIVLFFSVSASGNSCNHISKSKKKSSPRSWCARSSSTFPHSQWFYENIQYYGIFLLSLLQFLRVFLFFKSDKKNCVWLIIILSQENEKNVYILQKKGRHYGNKIEFVDFFPLLPCIYISDEYQIIAIVKTRRKREREKRMNLL